MNQYRILESDDIDELERLVNEKIAEGWMPSGSVAFTKYPLENDRKGYTEYRSWYGQAMVRIA